MNYIMKQQIDNVVYNLREVKAQFNNPCVLWSTGKDSTAMLDLCRAAFFRTVPFPVVHIDTGKKFPEIYEFRDKIADEWELDLRVVKHRQADIIHPENIDHFSCCQKLKTDMLQKVIEENEFDGIIISIRRDEHVMRNVERVTSPRDAQMKWRLYREKGPTDPNGDSGFIPEQDTQLWNQLETDYKFHNIKTGKLEAAHDIRIHPFLINPYWSEVDVWKYTKYRNLPYNPLYRADYNGDNKRYRSLGCQPCTEPIVSTASTIDEIISEIEGSTLPERAGRSQDKENRMRRLRALGYM